MAKYLDFYLADNGRMDYSRDISLVQYSTDYTVRLHCKKAYDLVNMNITLPDNIHTFKKSMVRTASIDGNFIYIYNLKRDITGIVINGDKAILKIGFFLYPDKDDTSKVDPVSLCYLPILATTQPEDYDGSVTSSYYDELSGNLNDIEARLDSLNVGKIDTAENYDTEKGTINEKFKLTDAQIGNLETNVALLLQIVGNVDIGGDSTVVENLGNIQKQLDNLKAADTILQTSIGANNTAIGTNALAIQANTNEINRIITEVLPILQAGVKYEVVSALPNISQAKNGVVYLVLSKNPEGINIYTEYMYINNAWEILGTTETNLDLSQYYTAAEINSLLTSEYYTTTQTKSLFYTKEAANSVFMQKTELGLIEDNINNISSILNQVPSTYETIINVDSKLSRKADKTTTLAGYGITDAYTKTQIDNKVSQDIKNASDLLQSQITGNDTDISNIQADIRDNIKPDIETAQQTADEALHIAQSKNLVLVFDSRAKMINFIKTKDKQYISNKAADETLAAIGTELLIKDTKEVLPTGDIVTVPDYWISAVFSTPSNYTTKFGETLTEVYYGIEESEGKTDLSDYVRTAQLDATNERVSSLENRATDLENTRERHENKLLQGESETPVIKEDTVNDVKYPTTKAVYEFVKDVDDNREKWTVDYAYEKSVSENYFRIDATKTNAEKFNEEITRIDEKDAEQDGRLTTLEAGLAAEITRATEAETTLQQNINAEQARAEAAELLLTNNLNAEVERAKVAEGVLQDNIDAENERALTAEGVLQDNIDAEELRATTVEGELTNLETEIKTNLVSAINEVHTDLNAEIERSTAYDENLDDRLEQEIKDRAKAIEDLEKYSDEQDVITLQAAKDYTDAEIEELKGGVSEAYDTLLEIEAELNKDDATEAIIINNIATNAARIEEVKEKFEDGTYIAEHSQRTDKIIDYVNHDNIRITTDVAEKDFTIDRLDVSNIQTMLSMFVPNEYNNI